MKSEEINFLDVKINSNEFTELLNNLKKSSSDVFKSIGKEFKDVISSACSVVTDQMAETIKENLGDEISEVNSSLQGACTAVFETFQEPLRNAAQEVAAIIDEITQNIAVGELGEKLANAALGLNDFVFAVTGLVADNLLPFAVDCVSLLAKNAAGLVEVAVPLTASVITFNTAMKGFTIWQAAVKTIQEFKAASESATIAQLAFNVAMEANPVGIIIAGLAAVTVGLTTFMATTSAAASGAEEYSRALERAQESGDNIIAASDKEIALIKHKAERYEELRQKYEDLTDGEMAEFLDLASDLAEILPECTSVIDEQTGKYKELGAAIEDVTKRMETQALLNAKYGEYEAAVANKYDIEKKIKKINEEWEFGDEGKEKINEWITVASGTYSLDTINDAEDAAKKAFIIESLRQEYGINYFELEEILAENQEIIDGYYDIINQQYEELANEKNILNDSDDTGNNVFENIYGMMTHYINVAQDWSSKAEEAKESIADALEFDEDKSYSIDIEKIMREKWDTISKLESLGLMSSEDAYKEQLNLIKKYCPEYSDEWYSYYKTIVDYQRNALKEQVQDVKDSIADIVSEYQEAFSEIENFVNSYKNKLLSVEPLFTITTETDENGNETTTYTVENLTEQMEKMQKYHDMIMNLKERGVSNEVLSELTTLDFDDGMFFAENLAGSSDAELEKITRLYAEKEKLAESLANELYAPEMDKLNTDLINGVIDQFGTLPDEIRAIGGEAINSFVMGLLDNNENLTEAAQEFMDNFFTACDEGISSGSIGMENVGENIAAILGEPDTYSIGLEMGHDLVNGLNDALSSIQSQLMTAQANVSAELVIGQAQSTQGSYAGSSWSGGSGKTEQIVLENHEDITVKVDRERNIQSVNIFTVCCPISSTKNLLHLLLEMAEHMCYNYIKGGLIHMHFY